MFVQVGSSFVHNTRLLEFYFCNDVDEDGQPMWADIFLAGEEEARRLEGRDLGIFIQDIARVMNRKIL